MNTQIDNPLEHARHWLEQDHDPETARELSGLIERAEAGNQ